MSARTRLGANAALKRSHDDMNTQNDHPQGKLPGQLEEVAPPDWRAVLSLDTDLGYPDFYPSHPGSLQPTHVLTANNIKLGYASPTVSSINQNSETFSIHHIINEKIKTRDVLQRASDFAKLILEAKGRRAGTGGLGLKREGGLPPHNIKAPSRAILNPLMRSLFLQDLANPEIPLEQLGKSRSLPSGLKGLELLDTLWDKGVDGAISEAGPREIGVKGEQGKGKGRMLDRAAWMIHVVGGHEVQALRNKMAAQNYNNPYPQLTASQLYSIDFTTGYMTWLGRQLAKLSLAGHPAEKSMTSDVSSLTSRLGVGSKGAIGWTLATGPSIPMNGPTGKTTLVKRDKWSYQWEYSLSLLRTLLERPGLVNQAALWSDLAHLLDHANMLQVGFVLAMIQEFASVYTPEEYPGDMLISHRRMVMSIVGKLAEISGHHLRGSLVRVEGVLAELLKQAWCTANDEVFTSTLMWRAHGDYLAGTHSHLMNGDATTSGRVARIKAYMDRILMRDASRIIRSLADKNDSSKRRIGVLHSIDSQPEPLSAASLDGIYARYFHNKAKAKTKGGNTASPLRDLLDWAVSSTAAQLECRVRATCDLLGRLEEERIGSRGSLEPVGIGDAILDWIVDQGRAGQTTEIANIARLAESLQLSNLMSYLAYINRLIALGLTSVQLDTVVTTTRHLDILRAVPLVGGNLGLEYQRDIALNGFPLTGDPVICDSPLHLDSPLPLEETPVRTDTDAFRNAIRRLSTATAQGKQAQTTMKRRTSGGVMMPEDTSRMQDLCYAGVARLGELFELHRSSTGMLISTDWQQEATPILDLLTTTGRLSKSGSQVKEYTPTPLIRLFKQLGGATGIFPSEGTPHQLPCSTRTAETLFHSILSIRKWLWPNLWSLMDVPALIPIFGTMLYSVQRSMQDPAPGQLQTAVEIALGYVEDLGKHHKILQQSVLAEIQRLLQQSHSMGWDITGLAEAGPRAASMSCISKHSHALQANARADRAWDHPPLPVRALSCPAPYRDSAVEFSTPTNSGNLSLASFGAVYTGDRLPSAMRGDFGKIHAEGCLNTGVTGKPLQDPSGAIAPVTRNGSIRHSADIIEISDEESETQESGKRRSGPPSMDAEKVDARPPPAKRLRKASLDQRVTSAPEGSKASTMPIRTSGRTTKKTAVNGKAQK